MRKNLLFLPVSLPYFIFLLALPFLLLAALSLLEIAPGPLLHKTLGLSVLETIALYLALLAMGAVNVPLYEFKSRRDSDQKTVTYAGEKYLLPVWHGHNTLVALNLGGCVVALCISVYFASALTALWPAVLLSIVIVALGVFLASRPSRSAGYYVPTYVLPALSLAVALVALYGSNAGLYNCARLAFCAGACGALLGTSLLNLPRLQRLGTTFFSLGGYGVFDGIFLTGIVATIVACALATR